MGWGEVLDYIKSKYPLYVSAENIEIATGMTRKAVYRSLQILRGTQFINVFKGDHYQEAKIYQYNPEFDEVVEIKKRLCIIRR